MRMDQLHERGDKVDIGLYAKLYKVGEMSMSSYTGLGQTIESILVNQVSCFKRIMAEVDMSNHDLVQISN